MKIQNTTLSLKFKSKQAKIDSQQGEIEKIKQQLGMGTKK